MNSGGGGSSDSSCFDSCQGFLQMYEGLEECCISPLPLATGINTCSAPNLVSCSSNPSTSLVHNLSVLREMVQQLQSLVSTMINASPPHHHHHHHHHHTSNDDDQQNLDAHSTVSRAASLIQDILAAASSLPFAFQQFVVLSSSLQRDELNHHLHQSTYNAEAAIVDHDHQLPNPLQGCNSSEAEAVAAAGGGGGIFAAGTRSETLRCSGAGSCIKRKETTGKNEDDEDGLIIEMDPADLLAKYTHFCQVCGKGFKRDANLRMHMRAHGDEYKTSAALSNPTNKLKNGRLDEELEIDGLGGDKLGGGQKKSMNKYSCPQEGCRWNRKHVKFQPLKSLVCVKNHYKRSHCPKMYVCNRCNRKQFSVLSDLRTHEKHCGDSLRWRCSCGTTFSRKDKLTGHLALFPTHAPAPAPAPNTAANFIQPHPQGDHQ